MSNDQPPFQKARLACTIAFATFCAWIGYLRQAGFQGAHGAVKPALLTAAAGNTWFPPEELPAPHLIPKVPGGTTLRFAMVHDVLHERYLKHGPAYYRKRNEASQARIDEERAAIDAGRAPTPGYFDALDDLAVGRMRLGDAITAISLMRRKLQLQREHNYPPNAAADPRALIKPAGAPLTDAEVSLYKTHANLGSFLMESSLHLALDGDPKSREWMREGLDEIDKAVAINPEAHFGRETWQLALGEFLLDSIESPSLLMKRDMIGNSLQGEPLSAIWSINMHTAGYGRGLPDLALIEAASRTDVDGATRERMKAARSLITIVGPQLNFGETANSGDPPAKPVPFDEPVLGILGMWTIGGGANAHFSLALAETMRRVGQFPIAWTAYERTIGLSKLFSPDDEIRKGLIEHCRRRQAEIEETYVKLLRRDARETRLPTPPPIDFEEWRERHRAELAFGLRWQREYIAFEERRIAEGIPIDDPDFARPFLESHEPIASPVGRADIAYVRPNSTLQAINAIPATLMGAGIGAALLGTFLRLPDFFVWLENRQRKPKLEQEI